MVFTEGPYVDQSLNFLVAQALQLKNVGWFLFLEGDNAIPPSFVDRILSLDPPTHPIVSSIYHGRVQDDQRPTSGMMRDGVLVRLTYPQLKAMYAERGLYPVDVVPTGATAIHRSVFETWRPTDQRGSWFRTTSDGAVFVGQDVNFCVAAKAQGFGIWLDTHNVSGHIGEWVSTDETYLATNAHLEATHGLTIDGTPAE